MYMPRLSLYKPEKGRDYQFIDDRIYEMFTVGGTDVHVHKYLGPKQVASADATADQPQYDVFLYALSLYAISLYLYIQR